MATKELNNSMLNIEKDYDLAGYIVNPKQVSEIVAKVFTIYGVDPEDIRCVRIGSTTDEKSEPKIIVEIRKKALKPNGNRNTNTNDNWLMLSGNDVGNDKHIVDGRLYDFLRNKAFYGKNKNLSIKQVVRNDTKYLAIELDVALFMAFVYNINYADPFYKISAPKRRWKSNDELDELSGKARKAYIREINEYKEASILPCELYITFKANSSFKLKNGDVITGFHPEEVEYFHSDDDNDKKKKNK